MCYVQTRKKESQRKGVNKTYLEQCRTVRGFEASERAEAPSRSTTEQVAFTLLKGPVRSMVPFWQENLISFARDGTLCDFGVQERMRGIIIIIQLNMKISNLFNKANKVNDATFEKCYNVRLIHMCVYWLLYFL